MHMQDEDYETEDLATQTYSRDHDDDKFIHTALAASAAWLVTGDQDLLVIETPLPVRILTAGEALIQVGFSLTSNSYSYSSYVTAC